MPTARQPTRPRVSQQAVRSNAAPLSERRQKRAGEILAAARKVFQEKGFERTAVSEVANRAGTIAMAELACALGVCFHFHTEVTGLQFEGGDVVGVQTTTGAVRADRVLVAAGSYSTALLRPLGTCPASRASTPAQASR